MPVQTLLTRRGFSARTAAIAGSIAAFTSGDFLRAMAATAPPPADAEAWRFRYLVGSSMYGYADVREILPEVRKCGATAIDLWPKVHGNQREQLDELGEAKFAELLAEHDLTLGCLTQYKLGPFGLAEEMRLAQRMKCPTIVTGAVGPRGLAGGELKTAIAAFLERMKPHLEIAEETGVRIAIENHANNLVDSADAMKWLVELRPSTQLTLALAPYHLPQDSDQLASLIRDLGDAIDVFYAWQHGAGSMKAQPREREWLQLPGRGELDFLPLVEALRDIRFAGWTEIFMHPYPRGLAIADTIGEVTAEIRRSADYLERLLTRV